jgi:hypothetical protein
MSLVAVTSKLLNYRSPFLRTILVSLIVAALLAGCRRPTGPIAQEQTNLSWLGSMYRSYASQNQGHPPKSIEELRKFVEKTASAEQLSRLKVANVNELFTSPRDGKPFALVTYDKIPVPAAGQSPPIVLYEAEGHGGQRAVAFLGGGTKTLDESELKQALPAPGKAGR